MRDAEATKERILDAAFAEFAAHGIAGARVDRIAALSGCNKNLIYIYFEDKETLFTTVLHKHLMRVHEEFPFTPDDLPGYAARVFDFAISHADLMRLMAWSALERHAQGAAEHATTFDAKVAALTEAKNAGQVATPFPPRFLLTAIMGLATTWSAASPFGPSFDPKATARPAALRKHIVEAVRLLADSDVKTRPKTQKRS